MNALQVAMFRAKCVRFEEPVPTPEPRQEILPRHAVIQRVVAEYYGVTRSDILSLSRKVKYVRPRWVALLLCREALGQAGSWQRLGNLFGGRDLTTIVDGVQRIKLLMLRHHELRRQVSEIRNILNGANRH